MELRKPVVWIAGTSWDEVTGTDKCLVSEISKKRPILWVDPPEALTPASLRRWLSRTTSWPSMRQEIALSTPIRNLWRLKVPPMRGASRPVIRVIRAAFLERAVNSALNRLNWKPEAVVVAHALTTFPSGIGGRKVYFVTDDWLEGASLMGATSSELRRVLHANLSKADAVATVSEPLLTRLMDSMPGEGGRPTPGCRVFGVVPNGSPDVPRAPAARQRRPTACLVGQLNERLDLDVLESLAAAKVPIVVIGPRTDRDPSFGRRMDNFLAEKHVEWLGRLDREDVLCQLQLAGVGITPYADTAFNRASFPLKTLEYLAAGLAVVSTETPSARWLDTELISLHSGPAEFVGAVIRAIEQRYDREQEQRRRDFALTHSWAERAIQFEDLFMSGTKASNPT